MSPQGPPTSHEIPINDLGDITREQVGAIVTAAYESLLGGGGVDGSSHRAAGLRLAEAGAAIAPCDPGDAKAAPAFTLDSPVRYVIHTVGPVWEGGAYGVSRPSRLANRCRISALAAS